jgi:hypothetical protein
MKHQELLTDLLGMSVSHVWFSDYTVFYLELGILTPNEMRRRDGSLMNPEGQISIYAGFDWRIERPLSIFCSRDSTRRQRESVCQGLVGTRISEVALFGRIPELSIGFSSGVWLATFGLSRGDPDWSISFNDPGVHLFTKRGRLAIEEPAKKSAPHTMDGNPH